MIPNPGQFNEHYYDKPGNHKDTKYYMLDGRIVSPGHEDYDKIHAREKERLKRDTCPHCGGSGKPPAAPYKKVPSNKHSKSMDWSRRSEDMHKPKKDISTAKDYNKKKYKPNDDDDKNPPMAGGSKVPRKPKPSPKGPGESRPIERKVDEGYARKLDRYRVLAR